MEQEEIKDKYKSLWLLPWLFSFVFLSALGIILLSEYNKKYIKLEYRINQALNQLSISLTEPLWSLDLAQLERALSAQMLNYEIKEIYIFDRTNNEAQLLKGFERKEKGAVFPVTTPHTRSLPLTFSREIIRNNRAIGEVTVIASDHSLKAEFLSFLSWVGLLVFFIVAGAFSLANNTKKLIGHPRCPKCQSGKKSIFGKDEP